MKNKINKVLKDFKIIRDSKGENVKVSVDHESVIFDIIRELHDGLLPHNWVFEKAHELLTSASLYDFESLEDLEDARYEIIDGAIEISNYNLYEWAKIFDYYVEDARREGLISAETPIVNQLQAGQFYQLDSMLNTLLSTIEEEVA